MKFPFLNKTIKVEANQPAIISNEIFFSFEQLDSAIYSAVKMLISYRIKPSSYIPIISNNNADFIVLLLALWRIKAIPIPLSVRLTETELLNQINFIKADIFFIHKELERKLKSVPGENKVSFFFELDKSQTPYLNISFNSDSYQASLHKINHAQTDIIGLSISNSGNRESGINHPALILFTSGSTGIPKAVILTNNNLISSAGTADLILNQSSQDKWLASLPFYHIGGIMIIVRALLARASVIIPDSFIREDLVSSMQKYKPTLISFVPTVIKRIMETGFLPYKELRYVLLGGGPVADEIVSTAILTGWKILKVYGSTETCSMITALNANERTDKIGSSGKPLPNVHVKIVDQTGSLLPPNSSGEISVSSPTLMEGYINNEEETKNKIKNGFYHTGDIGYIDVEGFLFVESRRTDLIISGGENINPAEIEEVLQKHPSIKEACVIGLEDGEWGQIPAAAIVSSGLIKENEIIQFLRSRIASYKIPRKIIFVNELPATELGKVRREKVRELFA